MAAIKGWTELCFHLKAQLRKSLLLYSLRIHYLVTVRLRAHTTYWLEARGHSQLLVPTHGSLRLPTSLAMLAVSMWLLISSSQPGVSQVNLLAR